MPENNKKISTELALPHADVLEFPVAPEVARMEGILRDVLGPSISDDLVSRLCETIRNIQRTREKIERMLLDMGADLQLVHDVAMQSALHEFGNTRGARMRGWDKFNKMADELLDIRPNQAKLHLNLYRRFLSHNGALEKLNIGELMVLRSNDYTAEEIDAVIEFKENDPSYKRKNIREFVERLRKKQEEVIDVTAQLEMATSELANTVSDNADKEFEIRRLTSEIAKLTTERDADRVALGHIREEMTRHNASSSLLQMQIDDLEREKRELQERIAFARANARTETVEVPVVPVGYATLEDALAAKNEQISAAHTELADIQSRRNAIESEINERSTVLERRTRASDELSSLVSQFEQIVSTFATAQLAVQMDGNIAEFRPTLTVLDSVVARLHADIRSALHPI
ncbi:hypothetical protein SAMN05216345_111107 [Cupriavidus sp. YR651]|uniref:hypothetical protein n=1 Tax=Cupriavidus sp. YR651 TaxID=1855315 RepID=UPI000880DE22|nr:hypothetical protein [Cupriavidus sp. YR651]SDD57606.1 hypothetical protein SAMN05216345_111107 [Cupriavidus sp. YR651]